MGEELKPCPFCGGTDLHLSAACYVHCRICGADGPVFDGQPDDDWALKIKKLWNTRLKAVSS